MTNTMDAIPRKRAFPACYVELPLSSEGRRAAFYLAAEEYIAAQLPEDNYLFSWVLSPTVVMGRNQVADREINLSFCQAEGIDIIRRKSGGGCIYADEGNIMFSLVTGPGAVEPLFEEYASCVADGLKSLGADVEVSGRNDIILAGGGKICGNAFYHLPRRNIVHGTMLYDTDARRMAGALTPDKLKLKAAGVASVRSRIGLLKDRIPLGVDKLRQELRRILCDRVVRLDEKDVRSIEAIEAGYYVPEFLFGKSVGQGVLCSRRIEGCGRLDVRLSLVGNIIHEVNVSGDFFEKGNVRQAFSDAFKGLPFTVENIGKAIDDRHPESSVRGLGAAELYGMMIENMNEES